MRDIISHMVQRYVTFILQCFIIVSFVTGRTMNQHVAPLKPRQHGALKILYCIVLYCNNICLSSRNVLFQTVDEENYGETRYLRFKGKMVIRMFSNTWIYRSIIHRMKQITLAQKPIRQQSKCNHMIDPKRTPLSVNQWLTFDLLTVLNLKKM